MSKLHSIVSCSLFILLLLAFASDTHTLSKPVQPWNSQSREEFPDAPALMPGVHQALALPRDDDFISGAELTQSHLLLKPHLTSTELTNTSLNS